MPPYVGYYARPYVGYSGSMSGQDTIYTMVTEKVINALETGTVPWRKPWTATTSMPRNGVSGKRYRGVNVLMLTLAGHGSPYWLSFKQVGELGGRVRKGEAGALVVFWTIRKTSRVVDGEKVTETSPFLRYSKVWNLDQTEGVTLPPKVQAEIETADDAELEPLAAADAVAAGYADGPKVVHGTPMAYYRPDDDTVRMPDRAVFHSIEEYYSTLFHELGHSTGHSSRLDRFKADGPGQFGSHGYGREELVAEMTAAFLCAEAGIAPATVDNHAAYVASWLRTIREDPRAVVVAAGAAQRAADHILGRGYEAPPEDA